MKLSNFLIVPILFASSVKPAMAISCEFGGSAIHINPWSSTTANLSITNNGPEDATTVKFNIQNSPDGTSGYLQFLDTLSYVEYTDNLPAVGDSSTYNVGIEGLQQTGDSLPSITAMISSDGGSNYSECSGSYSVVVEAPKPQVSLANMTVGNSSATLSLTTSMAASVVVNYGTTTSYGSSASSTSGTSHSISLSGLSASTLYHYQIVMTGENGTTTASDATFTTTAASSTSTVTTTVTETVTNTVSKTVVLMDTIKPIVTLKTKLADSYQKAPVIEGVVSDGGSVNAGLAKLEYSIDDGKNWTLFENLAGEKRYSFEFVPGIYDDGDYQVSVRATDQSGNVGVSASEILVIDRIPPKIMDTLIRIGPLVLRPKYQLLPNVDYHVVVQAIGGVTSLKLKLNKFEYDLDKNNDSGYFEGILNFVSDHDGVWKLEVIAKDGGGNVVTDSIGEVEVLADAVTLEDENLTSYSVYRYDQQAKKFRLWNGEIYGQANPALGKATWYLPSGRYFMEQKQKGYQSAYSRIFEMKKSGLVEAQGELSKLNFVNFFTKAKMNILLHEEDLQKSELYGRTIQFLDKELDRGREKTVFVSSVWEPSLTQKLMSSQESDEYVIVGTSQSSVDLLKARGGYKAKMVADPDGVILDDLEGLDLPINLKINRRSVVEGVEY